MYFPSTRLLTILDLLRAYGQMTAQELAKQLEVDTRTVRRYMVMLEDLGMPVETVRGRYGGYRLRSGYRLPPVIFSDDEALTLFFGLLLAERVGLATDAPETERTLAKLSRVAPPSLRDQIPLLEEVLTLQTPRASAAVTGAILLELTLGAYHHRPVFLHYQATDGSMTERTVDPYGLVYTLGYWYLAGYCHLRQALRTFRLDRIRHVEARTGNFLPPANFDIPAYVEESIARKPWHWSTQVQLHTTLATAQPLIPRDMALLEENQQGVLMRCEVADLQSFALFLLGLPCPLTILGPDELHTVMRMLANRASMLGTTGRNEMFSPSQD